MGQSKFSSFIEACINTAIGFMTTLVLAPVVYPLFGHAFTLAQNLGITAIFTIVSIFRGYAVRRWFNSRIKRLAAMIASQKATTCNVSSAEDR